MHAMRDEASREHLALLRWLDAGAPAERVGIPVRPKVSSGEPKRRAASNNNNSHATSAGAKKSGREPTALDRALVRGLANLPLDDRQRARARALARDPVTRSLCDGGASPDSVAAAVAYAIVYVDEVPLSQAEVAASFRVSGNSLRGRFAALRGHLHLFGDEAGRRRR
jgi:transcription initiation factor TFIIIB Brf1 subunit/transcription initiation factor TFIIB